MRGPTPVSKRVAFCFKNVLEPYEDVESLAVSLVRRIVESVQITGKYVNGPPKRLMYILLTFLVATQRSLFNLFHFVMVNMPPALCNDHSYT